MPHQQGTLFDMGPAVDLDQAPLLRAPDEVYEVTLKFQWNARTHTGRFAVQAKNAVTDELYSWKLSEEAPDGPALDGVRQAAIDRWYHEADAYMSPF